MGEIRDPLDRVSNSLRRAVSINKSQESDLRSTMSTIQRERRRSVNSWSLKQEKFLRAKQKFVPAFQPQACPRPSQVNSMVTPARRLTLIHGVSPESADDLKKRGAFPSNEPDSSDNPLPPLIVPGKRTKYSDPQGLTAPVVAIRSQFLHEPFGPTDAQLRRAQRVSEYKAAMDTDRETTSLQRRVRRFTAFSQPTVLGQEDRPRGAAFGQGDGDPSDRNGRIDGPGDTNLSAGSYMDQYQSKTLYRQDIALKTDGQPSQQHNNTVNQRDDGLGKRLSTLSEATPPKTAQDHWKKLRQSLKSIRKQSKPRDVGKMSLTEMTKLFEEIRECRYLRVGHNKDFRGDNAMGEGCKCLACTVSDKTKLKNNMSAPQ